MWESLKNDMKKQTNKQTTTTISLILKFIMYVYKIYNKTNYRRYENNSL